jgi:hypothetical protein
MAQGCDLEPPLAGGWRCPDTSGIAPRPAAGSGQQDAALPYGDRFTGISDVGTGIALDREQIGTQPSKPATAKKTTGNM